MSKKDVSDITNTFPSHSEMGLTMTRPTVMLFLGNRLNDCLLVSSFSCMTTKVNGIYYFVRDKSV